MGVSVAVYGGWGVAWESSVVSFFCEEEKVGEVAEEEGGDGEWRGEGA